MWPVAMQKAHPRTQLLQALLFATIICKWHKAAGYLTHKMTSMRRGGAVHEHQLAVKILGRVLTQRFCWVVTDGVLALAG